MCCKKWLHSMSFFVVFAFSNGHSSLEIRIVNVYIHLLYQLISHIWGYVDGQQTFHMNILFGLSETILPKPPWAANLEVPNVRLSSPAPESSITANDNHQIAENQHLDQLQNLFKQRSIHLPKFHPNWIITFRDKRMKTQWHPESCFQ